VATFGTQLSEAQAGLSGSRTDRTRVIIQIVISFALIAAGLYVILSKNYSADTQKLAAGWIGLVIGYWLK
jgi:hypothetical protein